MNLKVLALIINLIPMFHTVLPLQVRQITIQSYHWTLFHFLGFCYFLKDWDSFLERRLQVILGASWLWLVFHEVGWNRFDIIFSFLTHASECATTKHRWAITNYLVDLDGILSLKRWLSIKWTIFLLFLLEWPAVFMFCFFVVLCLFKRLLRLLRDFFNYYITWLKLRIIIGSILAILLSSHACDLPSFILSLFEYIFDLFPPHLTCFRCSNIYLLIYALFWRYIAHWHLDLL